MKTISYSYIVVATATFASLYKIDVYTALKIIMKRYGLVTNNAHNNVLFDNELNVNLVVARANQAIKEGYVKRIIFA